MAINPTDPPIEEKVIDVTPTWLELVEGMLIAHYNTITDHGRAQITTEFKRMAGGADAHVMTIRNMVEPTSALVAALIEYCESFDEPDRNVEAIVGLTKASHEMVKRWASPEELERLEAALDI